MSIEEIQKNTAAMRISGVRLWFSHRIGGMQVKKRRNFTSPGRAKSRILGFVFQIGLFTIFAFWALISPQGIARMQDRTNDGSVPRRTATAAIDRHGSNAALSFDAVETWQPVDEASIAGPAGREIIPLAYRTFRLKNKAFNKTLRRAPMEFTDAARKSQVIMALPLPDGTSGRFLIAESPVMDEKLAAKFPEIKTYSGQGVDDRTATARFDVTPFGFHAQVLSASETVYIDPYAIGDTQHYISYYKSDARRRGAPFRCLVEEGGDTIGGVDISDAQMTVPANGATLRTYRLALGATGEYTIAAGGTVPLAMARMTTSLNRVNGIYEREVAIRMTLVANNDSLIYTDPATDPYTNSDGFVMMAQHQTNVDTLIGPANYDMGHVFSTGGGGVARVKSTCNATFKAQGVTGLPSPVGDPFDVDYVAHEMGHQHGGLHTFNTIDGLCNGFRNMISAFEPASGSTPMSYVGTCAPSNLQPNSNDYFHVRSLEEIVLHMTVAGNCAAQSATGNTPPSVSAGANYTIPKNTPFSLTASASDVDGGPVTYAWEEYDLGPASPPEGDADGMPRPIFRSYPPTGSPTRTFPSLPYILANANVPPATYGCGLPALCLTGESLPTMTRTMNFQVTARDNRAGGGGIVSAQMQVSVVAGAGPFAVTAPNTAVSWAGGTPQTVSWDVAGTTAAPVSAASVNILFSSDGGTTFPITLAAGTANDGTETITAPNLTTAAGRIKVEAAGNIFFDISGANFSTTARPSFDFDGDGKSDLSVFRPANAVWYLNRSTSGFTAVQWGATADKLTPADFDGDGKADVAVWRGNPGDPDRSYFYILNSLTGTIRSEQFGRDGDLPLTAGDWDGDGKADAAVYRSGAGPGGQSTFFYRPSSQPGVDFVTLPWGVTGDVPLHGDYDGDGKLDAAVYRASDNRWYIRQSANSVPRYVSWGLTGDTRVGGDFDGDGKGDLAVYRTGTWYILQSSNSEPRYVSWGLATDKLVAADYDGDGKTDVAVFRDGTWYVLRSSNGLPQITQFGTAGDIAVPTAFQ